MLSVRVRDYLVLIVAVVSLFVYGSAAAAPCPPPPARPIIVIFQGFNELPGEGSHLRGILSTRRSEHPASDDYQHLRGCQPTEGLSRAAAWRAVEECRHWTVVG